MLTNRGLGVLHALGCWRHGCVCLTFSHTCGRVCVYVVLCAPCLYGCVDLHASQLPALHYCGVFTYFFVSLGIVGCRRVVAVLQLLLPVATNWNARRGRCSESPKVFFFGTRGLCVRWEAASPSLHFALHTLYPSRPF